MHLTSIIGRSITTYIFLTIIEYVFPLIILILIDATDWDYKRGNWQLFKTELERKMSSWINARYWNANSIEEKLNDFFNILNATLAKTIPKKKLRENTSTLPGGIIISLFLEQNAGN